MRKFIVFLILLLSTLYTASAETQREWDNSCRDKTSMTTPVYSIANKEASSRDELGLVELYTIPANTYYKSSEILKEHRLILAHFYRNGVKTSGWISADCITEAWTMIYFTDGSVISVPEALVKDTEAFQDYLKRLYPDKKLNGDGLTIPEEYRWGTAPGTPPPEDPEASEKKPAVQGDWSKKTEVSEEEIAFRATCTRRLGRTVIGYSDYGLTNAYETNNIGTHCRIEDGTPEVAKIVYYKNGKLHKAFVDYSALMNNYTQYELENGLVNSVNVDDPNYEKILEGKTITYLAETIQKDLDSLVEAERNAAMKQQVSLSKKNNTSETSASEENAQGVSVKVERIGLYHSIIHMDGEKKEVLTRELTFAEGITDSMRVAVIHAPRTGKCTLRAKPSDNGKAIRQCKAGQVAALLEYGQDYCRVLYDGETGYVQTSCLMFHDNANEPTEGMLTYNGKGTGKTTINIRCTEDKGSAKVAEWPTGTTVSVFAYEDGWYRIEYNGVHGFVMEEFLTMNE